MNEFELDVKKEGASPSDSVLTVSQLNKYINFMFKTDALLSDLWVRGEVSNFRPHYSGHMYFTLKDSGGTIKCVMFRSAASRLRFRLENGMKTIIRGNVSVFERDGAYQLYCEEIIHDGAGDLHTAFEQLKTTLKEEGLFDEDHKKPIPILPKSVAVITSETGSVVRDIINVSVRRFPNASIKVFPVQVQGSAAAPQIAEAVRSVGVLRCADVIIIARGGGSLEDLWAFNEEIVARAVFSSSIPIVSAIGHETDFTICDFVSDLRAPTPSAAAELVFPDVKEIKTRLFRLRAALKSALIRRIKLDRERLNRAQKSTALSKPLRRVEIERMRLDITEKKLASSIKQTYDKNKGRLSVLSAKLESLSPLAVLARGYAVVTDAESGKVVKSVYQTKPGQCLTVRFQDGGIDARVE
ncbi:MAG: exodeoxyribonuclease VII large subunit [Oscillospiraceae bacterium]|nr:exodeoxyribonuclease VII large subunit [Oscillospiraceae bacterium]